MDNDCFSFNNVNYCVVKSSNGQLWLNKDLESTAYFQWGRGTDGHQVASSQVISLNQRPIPFVGSAYSEFIINYTNDKNWVSSSFNNPADLWDSSSATSNNPCPSGWRVPNETDFICLNAKDINLLFGFTADSNGIRQGDKEGTFSHNGYYLWTNTLDQTDTSKSVKVTNGTLTVVSQRRDAGLKVRCLKN